MNDTEALKSFYNIYLKDVNTKKVQPSIVSLRKYEDEENLSSCTCDCNCSSQKRHPKSCKRRDTPKGFSIESELQRSRRAANKNRPNTTGSFALSSKFKMLPMAKVEFVREDHIKGVAEKRKKCKLRSASLYQKRNCQQHVAVNDQLWRRFGLLPVSKSSHGVGSYEEHMVLEDLEYQLTNLLRGVDDECESDAGHNDYHHDLIAGGSQKVGMSVNLFLWIFQLDFKINFSLTNSTFRTQEQLWCAAV